MYYTEDDTGYMVLVTTLLGVVNCCYREFEKYVSFYSKIYSDQSSVHC